MTPGTPSPRRRLVRSPLVTLLVVPVILVVAALSSLAVSAGTAAPAGADPPGTCSTSAGVIVVVDFSHWGGSIERGCDADLTTGYDALHAAGFTTSGDQHDGPEFICRIDNKPSPAEEPCVATPPASAYWSYWHADAGQNAWSYSVVGAASYQPQPGSVDAWTFGSTDLGGSGGQPSFLPSAVRAINPLTAPPTAAPSPSTGIHVPKRSRAGRVGTAAGRSQLPATATAPVTPSTPASVESPVPAPTTPSPSTSTSTTSATREPGRAVSGGSGGGATPTIVDATPASLAHPSTGSPAALLVGGALVVVLAAVAAAVARRRRRTG